MADIWKPLLGATMPGFSRLPITTICVCETLDDIKMHLSATEYVAFLQNEPSPLHTTTIVEKCTVKLVDEYKYMLCQATEPLSTFLEYITYGHMIDCHWNLE